VGGAFLYSDIENDIPPIGQETLLLVRGQLPLARDARLDLAWGKVKLGPRGGPGAAASSCRSPSPR